jgi:hypothetical protein
MAVYLGTATPSAYYLGSTTVSSIYLGTVQVYTTGGGGGGAAFYNPNTIWSGIFGSGDGAGTATDKYRKTSITPADGASIYVTAAGTVRVTASSASADPGQVFTIYKNGSSAYTRADNTGDGFFGDIPETGSNSCSIAVTAGNSITLGVSGDFMNFSTFRMWWIP